MDAAQFNQVLALLQQPRGGRKLSAFKETKEKEWRTWRHNFGIVATINGWNDQRQRREAAAAMEGDAQRAVSDINYEAAANINALLDAYQARFVTPAASDLARVRFLQANQDREEEVLAWHTRVRELFVSAYPGEDVNTSRTLIDRFVLGLTNAKVMEYVWDQRPATFAAALESANNKAASIAILARGRNGIPGPQGGPFIIKTEPGLHAMGAGHTCHYCRAEGHFQRECPELLPARQAIAREQRDGQQRDTNRGRGRKSRGGGGRGRGKPSAGREATQNPAGLGNNHVGEPLPPAEAGSSSANPATGN